MIANEEAVKARNEFYQRLKDMLAKREEAQEETNMIELDKGKKDNDPTTV
jgi:hypothetical protein